MDNIKNKEQDHIGYLNLIQANIARMAGNSALMKGFAATMLATMFGLVVSEFVKWYYIAILLVPLFAFIRLDIFYLQLERKYRNLYAFVTENRQYNFKYSLDLKNPIFKEHKSVINKKTGFLRTFFSVSVFQFYIWFVALTIILIILVA